MDIYTDLKRFPTLGAHKALQISPNDIRAALDLTADQWEEFCCDLLVPMTQGDARSINHALGNLVRGNRDGYTIRVEGVQVKRTAEILCKYELIVTYELDDEKAESYTDEIARIYVELLASMLDRHASVNFETTWKQGELDLFKYNKNNNQNSL